MALAGCSRQSGGGPAIITTIVGTVTDAQTSAPIEGAAVTTNPTTISLTTDASGNFAFDDEGAGTRFLEGMVYDVLVSKTGYQGASRSVTITEGIANIADVQMAPNVGTLDVPAADLRFNAGDDARLLRLRNTGAASLSFTANTATAWASVDPASGDIDVDAQLEITVSVDRTGLDSGEHQGSVSVLAGSAGEATVNLTLIVP